MIIVRKLGNESLLLDALVKRYLIDYKLYYKNIGEFNSTNRKLQDDKIV